VLFGDGPGSQAEELAAQTTALEDQWFLGTVYPGTTGDTGVGYDPSSGDSYKSVTGTNGTVKRC
jgi:hypothetical protein